MSRRGSSPWARRPGEVYEPPEFTDEGATPPSMEKLKSKKATRRAGRQRKRSCSAGRGEAPAPGPSSAITRSPRPADDRAGHA